MLTLDEIAERVADSNGMAWLADVASATGLSTEEVAELARVRGMAIERCDMPAAFRGRAPVDASEVRYTGGACVHFIRVREVWA
jgi:hypothetical protein